MTHSRELRLRVEAVILTLQLMQLELQLARDRLRIICAGAGCPSSREASPGSGVDQPAAPADLPREVGSAPRALQR